MTRPTLVAAIVALIGCSRADNPEGMDTTPAMAPAPIPRIDTGTSVDTTGRADTLTGATTKAR